jgi:predicted ester cyclase
MALFRRNRDKETAAPEAPEERPGKPIPFEELLQAPEVTYTIHLDEQAAENRRQMTARHLEAIHRPGGLAAVKQAADFMDMGGARRYLDALSEVTIEIDHQIVQLDNVATQWTVTGVHSGEAFGIPPSGERVTIRGVTMSIIREGLITTEYSYWDFPPLGARFADSQGEQTA